MRRRSARSSSLVASAKLLSALPVVVASDVIVSALSNIDPALLLFPAVPPATGHDATDVVGVFVRSVTGKDFALFTSKEILTEVELALESLGWSIQVRGQALSVIAALAVQSGGAVVGTTPRKIQIGKMPKAATSAVACAASNSLGPLTKPRVAVVDNGTAKNFPAVTPRGIPWPPKSPIRVMNAAEFRSLAEQARLKFRALPPKK